MKTLMLVTLWSLVLMLRAVAAPPPFRAGIEMPVQLPMTQAVEDALREMGIGYVNYSVSTSAHAGDLPANQINEAMLGLCRRLNLDFSISCHAIDPPDECVRAAVESGKSRFRGVLFNELEHCRLMWNYSPVPLADSGKFETLDQAYVETLDAYKALRTRFAGIGSPVTATHVWPVMHHLAGEAGFTVCPKICKESYSSVSLAIGMGAAKQYGTGLWADCDLWFWGLIPGHGPEELKSNLLQAYWLGVDLLYVEGAGHNLKPAGRQGTPFSLVNQVSNETFQLTQHGETLRWFCREYLPAHPRTWTFRDVRPSIAIVRFEDTCHGQRFTADFEDRLYGSPHLRSTPDTEAWLALWNLLTFGKTGRDGLSHFKSYIAPSGYQWRSDKAEFQSYTTAPVMADQHRFFVPLNGVVVYDHKAGYDLLKGVPLLFLTGTRVSEPTMDAIRRCVKEGAVCAAWGPLAKKHGFPEWDSGVSIIHKGKGKFVLTDDFQVREVYQQVVGLLGRPDEIRYRFGGSEVILRRVTDNEVKVEVTEK